MRGGVKKYLLLGCVLFVLMSLPLGLVTRLRGGVGAIFAPLWRKKVSNDEIGQKLKQVETDNFVLLEELKRVYALIQQQSSIDACQKELEAFKEKRRIDESTFLKGALTMAVPTKVIYRDSKCYSSSLWIDVGEKTNARLKRKVIAKNSPVVLGRQAVGVVEYVGQKQSRVRLITDSGLHPSVRAVRGEVPNNRLYLAKGTLEGAAASSWRKMGPTLRGVGFNYDFDDSEGSARALVSGANPIIKVGDHLITTGMDGVFPAGLNVGKVTHIYPLKEGAYTYCLDAVPLSDPLEDLSVLFVIPPLGYDSNEERN